MHRKFMLAVILALLLIRGLGASSYADESVFERGRNLYDVREYRAALSLFSRVIEEVPDNFEALDFAGWSCRYLGDWEKAADYFNKALLIESSDKAMWVKVGLGETLLGAGHYLEALAPLHSAIKDANNVDEAEKKAEITERAMIGLAIAYENIALSAGNSVQKIRENLFTMNTERASTLDRVLNSISGTFEAGTPRGALENLRGSSAKSANEAKVEPKNVDYIPFSKSFVLGERMETIVPLVKEEGFEISDKLDDPGRKVIIYKVSMSDDLFPKAILSADIKGLILEEYEGRLFKITAFAEFAESEENVIDKSVRLNGELLKFYTEQFGEPTTFTDDVINNEIMWSLSSGKDLLSVQSNVRLDGSMGIFITYTDTALSERYIKSF